MKTLREEYVTAALAEGGPRRTMVIRHVLRNSLIPLVTVVGPLLASLMTGTVFIEVIFRIPGLGLYFATAAASRDMPLLMGSALFFALILMTTISPAGWTRSRSSSATTARNSIWRSRVITAGWRRRCAPTMTSRPRPSAFPGRARPRSRLKFDVARRPRPAP